MFSGMDVSQVQNINIPTNGGVYRNQLHLSVLCDAISQRLNITLILKIISKNNLNIANVMQTFKSLFLQNLLTQQVLDFVHK